MPRYVLVLRRTLRVDCDAQPGYSCDLLSSNDQYQILRIHIYVTFILVCLIVTLTLIIIIF